MTQLRDAHDRPIDYLRISVTDRCDFRCVYCMAEDMTFLPRQRVLGLEELERIARIFVGLGVKKIRLTGGEPLVRQGIVGLCERIAALPGLRELVMTTNGSQLVKLAEPLARAGVKRLNISLDSLDAAKFHAITRTGELRQVLDGIDAARAAGFERIKLNAVVMKGRNAEEVADLVDFAIASGLDLSFIEEMPLGDVGRSRGESFCSSDEVRALIAERHALIDSAEQSGGPARYVRLPVHPQTRIGFISPHSHNFCATLQPCAADRRRPSAAVPGPRAFHRPARAAAPSPDQRPAADRRHPRRAATQAAAPRFHPQGRGAGAALHERQWRLTQGTASKGLAVAGPHSRVTKPLLPYIASFRRPFFSERRCSYFCNRIVGSG